MAYKVKKDAYQRARGGSSRILDVTCEGCLAHIAYYQKDGPGILKRMYSDRFIDIDPAGGDPYLRKLQKVTNKITLASRAILLVSKNLSPRVLSRVL